MIYLDTSCLLKFLREEPQSQAVRDAIKLEKAVVISSLTELETEVQLKASALAGALRTTQWRQYQARLSAFRNIDPFLFRYLPAAVFSTALKQHRKPDSVFCRSLDRLHLAAMAELNLERIMTLDTSQALVAEFLNFEVVVPGRD